MSHERWHVIEKIQVEIAAILALALVYFVAWPVLRPTGVDGTFVFLPIGEIGSMLIFAVTVWLLAALCAVVTISARMEGAMLALQIGVAGFAFRTEPMRLLLNRFEGDLASLMAPLAIEVAVLAVVLLGAAVVIRLIRFGLGRVCPPWMLPAHAMEAVGAESSPRTSGSLWATLTVWLFGFGGDRGPLDSHLLGLRPVDADKGAKTTGEKAMQAGACFGVTLFVSLLGMVVTLQSTGSTERGQILFSLAVSFFIGAFVANNLTPAESSAPCWLAPLALALGVYVKTCWAVATPPLTWATLDVWANIFPIDWFSAGVGGAVGGYWLSSRLHEVKHIVAESAA